MQAVHESGHVLGAWFTGGRVQKVVLHPLTISRTDVSPNPSPLVEVWLGSVWGAVGPLLIWITTWMWFKPFVAWLRFFAGFCLIANGCYLGYGIIEPIGDADELLKLGTPRWQFGLFSLLTVPLGFRLWHGLGPEFGIGPNARPITWWRVGIKVGVLITVIVAEMLLSERQ
jgi:hypothetical protein